VTSSEVVGGTVSRATPSVALFNRARAVMPPPRVCADPIGVVTIVAAGVRLATPRAGPPLTRGL